MRATRRIAREAVALCLALAIFAGPTLAPYPPSHAEPQFQNSPPAPDHLLGRDGLGRDIWSRLLWGAQPSLGGAMLATMIALLFGVMCGGVGGLTGGIIDQTIVLIIDVTLAIPSLLLAFVALSLLGEGHLQAAVAIGVSFVPAVSRLARASVISAKAQGYVSAGFALGGDLWWVARFHIARNVVGAVASYGAIVFAWSTLNLAAFDFLGLTGNLSTPGWGRMLNDGRAFIRESPLAFLAPGLAIVLAAMAFSAFTDEWRANWLKIGK